MNYQMQGQGEQPEKPGDVPPEIPPAKEDTGDLGHEDPEKLPADDEGADDDDTDDA